MNGWIWQSDAQQVGENAPGQYAYIGSGGMVFGGTLAPIIGYLYSGTGGLALSGEADILWVSQSNDYEYVGSGGLQFSGVARLPNIWTDEEFPAEADWVTDPHFGRGF